MDFTNPFFITLFSSGVIFILAGIISIKYPPKGINMFYGYRTSSSMKSQERWDFAQKYSNKKIIFYGLVSCAIALLSVFIEIPISPSTIFAAVMVILVLCGMLIYNTETAIKRKFGK